MRQSWVELLARQALFAIGLVSGVALTVTLTVLAWRTPHNGRVIMIVMIVMNLFMLMPAVWRALPGWLHTGLAVARGLHWVINLAFAGLGLLLLMHAQSPRRALALMALSLMFVLWAAAARRLTQTAGRLAAAGLASLAP